MQAIDINGNGALVASPEALSQKFGVVLANPSSGTRASGWVVRCAAGDVTGTFEVAIEFIERTPAFRGSAGLGGRYLPGCRT